MNNIKEKEPLLIIDGYGFIFRAYHVQPPLTSPSGKPVGAIYGFTSMLIKLLADFKPKYAIIALDHPDKNFRHDLYDKYKANRPPAPEDLKEQLQMLHHAAEALNFKYVSKKGFEADDVIATLATQSIKQDHPAIIISADKDLMQLIGNNVLMYDPARYKYIREDDIIKKFGVGAEKAREVQALIGDKSDNIPGVAGVGPKTASALINTYGTVENILDSINELTPRQQKLFTEHKENALISWKLVGLDTKVPMDTNFNNFTWEPPQESKISDFIHKNGFKSLVKRVENLFKITLSKPATDQAENKIDNNNTKNISIDTPESLNTLINKIKIKGKFAFDVKDHGNILLIALDYNNIYEINLNPNKEDISTDLFAHSQNNNVQSQIRQKVTTILNDPSIKKFTWDIKKIEKIIGINFRSADDIMIMDYVLNAGNKARSVGSILEEDESDNIILRYLDCYEKLYTKLIKQKNLHIYQSIDLPIASILLSMENSGVKIDLAKLELLSEELSKKIKKLELEIYEEAGCSFNISSPKQLGTVLFDNLKLPFGKIKGKSESYSTSVDILEKLKIENYKIAELLLEYRHLSKLKNTYVDTLPKQASQDAKRIHTTFLQCSTSTSRLSSINPNVQNIPIRTLEGSKIRQCFIAQPKHKLVSADYSQIELRILSYVANIASLKNAFENQIDIHSQTASQIFKIPLQDITPEIRRKAKAINFGIIYGISAFGLAKQLGISQGEASEYIKLYFQEYPGIKQYMDETTLFAKQHGYVTNLLGRRCYLPLINDKNHALRNFAQRAAINAPMQSLASDIVKIAMIKVNKLLLAKNLKTRMILQIHDELIFESPDGEVEAIKPFIKTLMEEPIVTNKTELLTLRVKISSGDNWNDL